MTEITHLSEIQGEQQAVGSIPSHTEPLWTVEDVARYLRYEPEWVRKMAKEGKLPGFKVGKAWRFRHEDIRTITIAHHNPDIA